MQTAEIATERLAGGLGAQLAELCTANDLKLVGLLYLPEGSSPGGMEGVLHAGAWQLVCETNRGVLRARVITPVATTLIPAEITARAAKQNTPIFFTGGGT